MGTLYGAIEAGGTKFVCAVGSNPTDLHGEVRFPTTTPAETLGKVVDYFREMSRQEPLSGIGIACFGPLDLNPASPTHGYITTTPKPGWAYTDVAGTLQKALNLPVAIDTDVNVAALGEYTWGAGKELNSFIYLTIGTGIGGGGLVNGRRIHGLVHPEMGHVRIPHDWQTDPFPGICPYHGDCLEGMANGPALLKRWGKPGEELPPEHPAWPLEATYLANGLCNFICTLSPQRITLGGGIMDQTHLLPMIRKNVQELLNGYITSPAILEDIDSYIIPPALGKRAGILGGIALAQES